MPSRQGTSISVPPGPLRLVTFLRFSRSVVATNKLMMRSRVMLPGTGTGSVKILPVTLAILSGVLGPAIIQDIFVARYNWPSLIRK